MKFAVLESVTLYTGLDKLHSIDINKNTYKILPSGPKKRWSQHNLHKTECSN